MATRAASPWVLGARSETGYVRTANEDRMGWTRTPYGDVYVVSDGMGGYRGGAIAAEVTIATLQERLAGIDPDSPQFAEGVQQAFGAANDAVRERRDPDDLAVRDMGATGVALITTETRFAVAHVGDSRAYLWRGGQLRQLTRDHSRVQGMMDSGLLTPEQAAAHPDASVLERAIGHKPTVQADVGEWLSIEPHDVLLLCSDGLSGYVSDREIAAILKARASPQETTDRLIECALGKGGEDNVTVQLVGYAPPRAARWWLPIGRVPMIVATAAVTALIAGPLGYFGSQRNADPMRGRAAEPPAQAGSVASRGDVTSTAAASGGEGAGSAAGASAPWPPIGPNAGVGTAAAAASAASATASHPSTTAIAAAGAGSQRASEPARLAPKPPPAAPAAKPGTAVKPATQPKPVVKPNTRDRRTAGAAQASSAARPSSAVPPSGEPTASASRPTGTAVEPATATSAAASASRDAKLQAPAPSAEPPREAPATPATPLPDG